MTTPAAAAAYLAQHMSEWGTKGYAVYNPKGLPVESLPVIYGFNNGGEPDWWHGALLAEDGAYLGGHFCSHEGYMPSDLGILEGSRPDRHEGFRQHYPDGYRMDFVPLCEAGNHAGLSSAVALNQARQNAADGEAEAA
jgi:hypothetical protein